MMDLRFIKFVFTRSAASQDVEAGVNDQKKAKKSMGTDETCLEDERFHQPKFIKRDLERSYRRCSGADENTRPPARFSGHLTHLRWIARNLKNQEET
ncbi:hypothetical protein [Rhizobium paknamense]|uniref:Uncharacterized protein n=1 Tax=Rhizobium paknamense TaxID=1206817 RepID=A0ABU0I8T6_9HYPH|nr:hypothetical protein [Rhizobium paknamense]MDQ0453696.1 hypothetical protein [Rhizobium paknamense]